MKRAKKEEKKEKEKNNDAEKRKRKALRNRRRGFCISQRTKHIFRVFFRMTDGKRLTYVMSLEMWLLYDPSHCSKVEERFSGAVAKMRIEGDHLATN